MKINRYVFILISLLLVVMFALPSASLADKLPKKLHWDATHWSGPSVFSHTAADFAKDMAAKTDGRWEIQIHFGGVLAKSKETVDGIKGGLFEFTSTVPVYHPGKTPLTTVIDLPFFGPSTMKQRGQWMKEIAKHPAIVKEWKQWDMRLLFPVVFPSYNMMSKVPITKVEDFKGLRVRIDPSSGKPLEPFGAIITMLPGPDIYTALDRRMLDAVSWIWTYTFGKYKLYEKCKYAILGLDQKTVGAYWGVSISAWDKLPDEWKKLAQGWADQKATERFIYHVAEADKKYIPIFEKAGVKVSQFPAAERAKLVEKSEASYQAWIKSMEDRGLPGKEVFEYAKAKRDEIMATVK